MTTPEELTELLAASPKEASKRKRLALEIAAKGSQDVAFKMDKLAKQNKKSAWREVSVPNGADVAGTTRMKPNAKHAAKHRPIIRTIPHATVVISYKLRNRKLYYYKHDVAFYFDAARRNIITEMEFAEYVENIELMG